MFKEIKAKYDDRMTKEYLFWCSPPFQKFIPMSTMDTEKKINL